MIQRSTQLNQLQVDQIHRLWNDEYPVNLKDRLGTLLNETSNHRHFYLINNENNIIAWSILFENEGQDRFSIIVSRKAKGQGLGKQLLNCMKAEVETLSGWVIEHENDRLASGENYQSPIAFYLKNGFEVLSNERLETPIISSVKVKWSR